MRLLLLQVLIVCAAILVAEASRSRHGAGTRIAKMRSSSRSSSSSSSRSSSRSRHDNAPFGRRHDNEDDDDDDDDEDEDEQVEGRWNWFEWKSSGLDNMVGHWAQGRKRLACLLSLGEEAARRVGDECDGEECSYVRSLIGQLSSNTYSDRHTHCNPSRRRWMCKDIALVNLVSTCSNRHSLLASVIDNWCG